MLPGAAGRSTNSSSKGKAGFQKLQKNLSEDGACSSPRYGTTASETKHTVGRGQWTGYVHQQVT